MLGCCKIFCALAQSCQNGASLSAAILASIILPVGVALAIHRVKIATFHLRGSQAVARALESVLASVALAENGSFHIMPFLDETSIGTIRARCGRGGGGRVREVRHSTHYTVAHIGSKRKADKMLGCCKVLC